MRNTDAGMRVGWAVIPARAASIALLWLLTGLFAFAAEAVELPPFGSQEYLILGIVLLLAFAALGFGFYPCAGHWRKILAHPRCKRSPAPFRTAQTPTSNDRLAP